MDLIEKLGNEVSVPAFPPGTLSYSYDGNGNVITRTDGGGAVTTYAYDALNRLTGKTYNDGIDPVTYVYDQASVTIGNWSSGTLTNTTGRMVEAYKPQADTGQTGSVFSYDSMGRPKSYWQCASANCGSSAWQTTYNYDLAGDVTSWTHPAGFTITNTVSTARRVTAVSSSLSDATHPSVLAQNITYTPWGALSGLRNGCAGSGCTSPQETYGYNNRLQPNQVQLGIAPSDLSHYYNLTYNYALPGGTKPPGCALDPAGSAGNNGNVIGYTFTDNLTPSLSHSALYVYDSLNRLACAQATGNSTYNLAFSYDRFGNMACVTNASTQGPCPNWTYNGNNQINSPGYTYEPRGNLNTDGQHSYQWQAEGRLEALDLGATWNSTYDALGQLAEVFTPGTPGYATALSERLWDPVAGQEIGRYDAISGTWMERNVHLGSRMLAYYYNDNTTRFLHFNALGSTSMVTWQNGSLDKDLLFYPWGQQWTSSGGLVDQHFASMPDLDVTVNMYPTANRWQAPIEGRWISPDPAGIKAVKMDDPQTWNMYAYVRNNPTTLTDPTGLFVQCSSSLGKKDMATCLAIQDAAYEKNKNGSWKYQKLHDIYTKLNDDERVWTIQKATLSAGTLGVTTLQGANAMGTNFAAGTINMDFNQIRGLATAQPSSKVPGFDMFAGITGNKTLKILENFGHEGAHGAWAIDNPSPAATLQNLIDVRAPMHYDNPQLLPLGAVIDPLLNLTETYAQQQEQIVNTELNGNPQ